MNRENIIRMAREAGFEQAGHLSYQEITYRFISFAFLVASAEREACANLLEQAAEAAKNTDPQGFVWRAVKESAEAIRARGQA
jgi:uncharacterized protein YktB (UPF0637 family)